jgi:hypothetical protein
VIFGVLASFSMGTDVTLQMMYRRNMLQNQEFVTLTRKDAYAQLLNKENFADRLIGAVRLNYYPGRLLPPNPNDLH